MASMLRDRTGKIDIVLMFILYIALTAVVLFIMTKYVPFIVYGSAAKTFDVEKIVYAERAFSAISKSDEITLRRQSFIADAGKANSENLDSRFFSTERREEGPVGLRINVSKQLAFVNKGFFDYAFHLKTRYSTFKEKRPALIFNRGEYTIGSVEVSGVFNPRLEEEKNE